MNYLLGLFLAVYAGFCTGCQRITLESDSYGDITLTKLPISSSLPGALGRSSYASTPTDSHGAHYLYFSVVDIDSGTGRWILNDELGVTNHATAFVDSWAVEPYHVGSINDGLDNSRWQVTSDDAFVPDDTMSVFCIDEAGDSTVYFESSHLTPAIAGFYVSTETSNASATSVYSHVRSYSEYLPQMYMYKYLNRWMIGEKVGFDECMSFVNDDADTVQDILSDDWHFMNMSDSDAGIHTWTIDMSSVIFKGNTSESASSDVYEALREHRSLKVIPTEQQYTNLRNKIPMPSMGLGTGGLYSGEETVQTLKTALSLGYRLFDLAREYNNERVFASVLQEAAQEGDVYRNEIFIESKVWPTELGFNATTNAIHHSLEMLNTNYIDLYLLHWPTCYPDIDWMHCEDTVDPNGTWRESWRALEKAYAEGSVMSIGVSNFDVHLLNELSEFASIRPHVVQNFAEPGNIDGDVRLWCRDHGVLYQPYASMRNLDNLPPDVLSALQRIGAEKAVSPHSVALRFFIQSGSGVIPRSKDASHLKENLEAFSYELTDAEMIELGWPSHDAEL